MRGPEFQTHVIDVLGRLETKMDGLVGKDGNNGRMGDLEDRVAILEDSHSRGKGIIAAFLAAWSAALVAVSHFWKN